MKVIYRICETLAVLVAGVYGYCLYVVKGFAIIGLMVVNEILGVWQR